MAFLMYYIRILLFDRINNSNFTKLLVFAQFGPLNKTEVLHSLTTVM